MSPLILGTRVDPTDYTAAARRISEWAQSGECRYVCAANVHMVMEAYDSSEFREIVNNADLVVPDGMPVVWMLRLKGTGRQARVYGPELMLRVIEAAAYKSIPVGFYGTTPEVLEKLMQRIQSYSSKLTVTYSFSPPFRDLSAEESEAICETIRQSGARILFVGLGCPKQERWMAMHHDRIPAVMIGVGAAFDFHARVKSQAPSWMQNAGFEWLFRLLIEPRRLWRRYLYHNPRFIFLAIADLLGFLR